MNRLPGFLTSCLHYLGASRIKALLAFCLGLALAGCTLDSSAPLSPPAPLPANSPLIGTWIVKDENSTTYYHVGNEGTLAKLVEVVIRNDHSIQTEMIDVSATDLDGKHYLNVKLPGDKGPTYLLYRYQIDSQNTLTLYTANFKFLADAIKAGTIKGTVHGESVVPNVSLDAPTTELRDFVAKHGDQVFTEELGKLQKAM